MNCEHVACILIVFAQIVTCYVKAVFCEILNTHHLTIVACPAVV